MGSSRWIRIGAALLLGATALSLAACACTPTKPGDAINTTASPVATSTVEPSAGVSASGTPGASNGTSDSAASPRPKGISASDAKAIEAELSAIQRELDRLSLPSDKDFGGIESGLE